MSGLINNYPKYINPFERGYLSYNDHLVAFNREFQKEISEELSNVFKGFKGTIAIATTGSDARLEKGPVSLIEIILFDKELSNLEEVSEKIKSYVSGRKGINLFDQDIEIKNIKKDNLYEFRIRRGEPDEVRRISPNRVFDARILFATNEVYPQLIKKFVDELNSHKGIFKNTREKAKAHQRITASGFQKYKGKEITHYDFREGVAFYDIEKNLWSFKQGPLRAVQYALVRDAIKKIRSGSSYEIIFSLPKNTIEKLSRIEVEGITSLSPFQMEDLSSCYKYFLHLYHKSQTNYKKNFTKETEFDSKEVKERCKSLEDLCKLQIMK